ncbi:MAG: NADH-quinone oxidoreductase subunit NuoK [bacterium]
MGTSAYMFLSAVVFSIGLLTVLIRRNLIIVLMGIELMLNAANINLVAFSYHSQSISGQIFTIFSIVIAAAEAAIGLAIALSLWRSFENINIDEIGLLK